MGKFTKTIYAFFLLTIMQGIASAAISCDAHSMSDHGGEMFDHTAPSISSFSHSHHSEQALLEDSSVNSDCCDDDSACAMSHCQVPGILALVDLLPVSDFSATENINFSSSPATSFSSSLYRPPILS